MRITIRLYKRHDLDLLSLYFIENYNFKEEFKKAIQNYIDKTVIANQIPKGECPSVSSLPAKISFHINLNEQDGDIKKWILGITRGRRNNIMKNIFRNTFPPIVKPYLNTSENAKYKF